MSDFFKTQIHPWVKSHQTNESEIRKHISSTGQASMISASYVIATQGKDSSFLQYRKNLQTKLAELQTWLDDVEIDEKYKIRFIA